MTAAKKVTKAAAKSADSAASPDCRHISCNGYATCRRVTPAELAGAPDLTVVHEQLELDLGLPPVKPVAVTDWPAPASTFAPAPLPPPGATTVQVDPLAQSLADALADGIWMGDATAQRSMQTAVGFSQIGGECDRRLVYQLRGARPVNFPDPLRAIVGTGVHLILADYWRRLDGGTGRYLVEQRLLWQGVPGTVDLFDRRRRVVIDWKTTTLDRVKRYRSQGPTRSQVIQIMGYGAALQAAGELVESVALAFVPTDGELADIYVWRAPLDVTIAQRAVDRLATLNQQPTPATVPATPSALCRWCSFHRPGSTDLTISCPGKDQMS